MKKRTSSATAMLRLGFTLLLFVGYASCQQDGPDYDLLDDTTTTTVQADASDGAAGTVTDRSTNSCECEYKIYSIDGDVDAGNHLEMMAKTENNNCSTNCPYAHGIYGICMWFFQSQCTANLGSGSISLYFPSRWIPFNCTIPAETDFDKTLFLSQVPSDCSTVFDGTPGEIVYGIRCKGICSTDWEYSASTVFTIPSAGHLNFDISMAGDCGCLPTIEY